MKLKCIKRISKENYILPIIIVLIAGVLLTWWTAHRTYLEMRNDLLQHVRIVAQCINLERVVSLSGTETDLDKPDYIRLKNQLMNARSANPKCRFIYLMGRNTDGRVFFSVDSEPTGSKDESPPGQIYDEVSDDYLLSFNTKQEMTVGPITDRWGEWVTFLIPIIDQETGNLITVMGMDIDISDWYISITKHCIFPVGLSLCILLLCIFVIKLKQINQRFEDHEEKYQESEKRYRNLFENALVGLFRSRLSDGLFLEINSKGAELLLHTKEEIIGKIRTTDLFRNLDQRTRLLSELKEKGEVNGFETDFTLDDGAEKTFSISVKSYPKEGFMEGAVIDVTEQKLMEKALIKSEKNYRMLVETTSEGLWIINTDKITIDVNQSLCNMLGYTREEMIGHSPLELLDEDNRQILLKQFSMVATIPNRQYELSLISKSGNTIHVMLNASRLHNDSDEILGSFAFVTDITEQKQIETALRESEQYYRILADNVSDVIWKADMNLRYTYLSPSVERLLGFTNKEHMPKTLKQMITPTSFESAMKVIAEEMDIEKNENKDLHRSRTLEIEQFCKNGSTIWTEVKMTFLRDKNDKAVEILGITRDITERKKAEEEHAIHLSFLQNMELINRVIHETNSLDQMMSNVLESTLEIFNCDRAWLLYPCDPDAKSYLVPMEKTKPDYPGAFEITHELPMNPGLAQRFRDLLNYAHPLIEEYDPGEASWDVEDLFSVRSMIAMVIYPNIGKPWSFGLHQCSHKRIWTKDEQNLFKEIGYRITDALSSTLHLRNLHDNEEKFRALTENINDVTLIINLEGKIIYSNPSTKTHGYNPDEITGLRPHDFVHPNDLESLKESWNNSIHHPETTIVIKDFQIRHKNGNWINVEGVFTSLLDNPSINGIVFNGRDITEKRKMEEELLKARKLESVGILAGGIAHDFNNLLMAIIGNISLAKTLSYSPNRIIECLDKAEKASNRAQNLTQQLLTFSKGGAPVKETANVIELIKDTATFSLRGSNVFCEFDFPKDIWLVDVDKGQFSQVIQNLVINANQAMPEGGIIKIKGENITISNNDEKRDLNLQEGDYLRLSIKDQGIGISKEHLPKIFDPYFTTKQEGSGLGLATTYSIVINHEGTITIESQVGSGTTFNVFLPVSKNTPPSPKEEVQDEILTGQGRILIMDDEEMIRDITGQILEEIGYQVDSSKNGAEALDKYEKNMGTTDAFDAVIMDLTIPGGMGGKEAIEKLLEIDPFAKAIVSSGYSGDPIMANYKKFGFCGVICKPYKYEEIGKVLHQVLSV